MVNLLVLTYRSEVHCFTSTKTNNFYINLTDFCVTVHALSKRSAKTESSYQKSHNNEKYNN